MPFKVYFGSLWRCKGIKKNSTNQILAKENVAKDKSLCFEIKNYSCKSASVYNSKL